MKASELRIGNITNKGPVLRIYPDSFTVLWNASIECHSDSVDISPIPLTEEWLLKFGFQRKNNAFVIKGSEFEVWNQILKPGVASDTFNLNASECAPEIKYVHQLQNLYFALTGEELTIKP